LIRKIEGTPGCRNAILDIANLFEDVGQMLDSGLVDETILK
jgi:hypothetical protein